MQPVKIVIQGDYLDCQIYRGRLYLWTFDGLIKTLDWYDLIDSLSQKQYDKIAFKFCFLDGNYLYKSDLVELFKDKEFKDILLNKFTSVASQSYFIDEDNIIKHLLGVQDNLGNNLPTDTEIFGNKLYYINEKGLYYSGVHGATKHPISSKTHKLWDCNLLSIKANRYPQLALSAGNDGLFELGLYSYMKNKEPYQISKRHSSFSNYTFWSVYSSSLIEDSCMALFSLEKNDNDRYEREYNAEIVENEIFNAKSGLSWGVEDKIYRATQAGFEVVKFNNKPLDEESYFTKIRDVSLHAWKGKVVGGGSSYFGNIVECENALIVVLSDGTLYTIEGPITRWRIYPRSLNYQNHLHVIKDNCIEIYSFNQDYFLNQEEKILGTTYKPQRKGF